MTPTNKQFTIDNLSDEQRSLFDSYLQRDAYLLAINLFREASGVSLMDAKLYVDSIKDEYCKTEDETQKTPEEKQFTVDDLSVEQRSLFDSSMQADVLVVAIKIFREASGMSLLDAKLYVESIKDQYCKTQADIEQELREEQLRREQVAEELKQMTSQEKGEAQLKLQQDTEEKQLTIDNLSVEQRNSFESYIQNGMLINAIQLFRVATGASLTEAKLYVYSIKDKYSH